MKVGDPLEAARWSDRSSPRRSEVVSRRWSRLASRQGGRLVAGGERPDQADGVRRRPDADRRLQADKRAVQEEIFGPVVVVVPFDEEDEAVELANGTEFGLDDYVFSADTGRAMRVAWQLRSGNVGINTAQRNHEAPFGGFKQSGVGRDGGTFGLHAYSDLQSITWPG